MDENDFLATRDEIVRFFQRLMVRIDNISDAPDRDVLLNENTIRIAPSAVIAMWKHQLPIAFHNILERLDPPEGFASDMAETAGLVLQSRSMYYDLRELMRICFEAGRYVEPADFRETVRSEQHENRRQKERGNLRGKQEQADRAAWELEIEEFARTIRSRNPSVSTREVARLGSHLGRPKRIPTPEWLEYWDGTDQVSEPRGFDTTYLFLRDLEKSGKLTPALAPARSRKKLPRV